MDKKLYRREPLVFLVCGLLCLGLFNSARDDDICFVGDVMPGRGVQRSYLSGKSLSADSRIKRHLASCSQVIGNFEGAVPCDKEGSAVRDPSGIIRNTFPKAALSVLSGLPFSAFSLRNNHSDDTGPCGKLRTADLLQQNGWLSFGTNPRDFLTMTVNGVRYEIVSVNFVGSLLEPENRDTPEETASLIAGVKPDNHEIRRITYIHWGTDYERDPSWSMGSAASVLSKAGFDYIVGHHSHVPGGYRCMNKTLVFDSLGNFIFDDPEHTEGWILKIRPDGSASLLKVTFDYRTMELSAVGDVITIPRCE